MTTEARYPSGRSSLYPIFFLSSLLILESVKSTTVKSRTFRTSYVGVLYPACILTYNTITRSWSHRRQLTSHSLQHQGECQRFRWYTHHPSSRRGCDTGGGGADWRRDAPVSRSRRCPGLTAERKVSRSWGTSPETNVSQMSLNFYHFHISTPATPTDRGELLNFQSGCEFSFISRESTT